MKTIIGCLFGKVIVPCFIIFYYFSGYFDYYRLLQYIQVSNLTGIPPGNVFSYLQVGHLLLCKHQRTMFLCEMSIF